METLSLEDRVEYVGAHTVAQKTRETYLSSMVRFIQWLYENKRTLLTRPFMQQIEIQNNKPTPISIKEALSMSTPFRPPLLFNRIDSNVVKQWIVSLETKEGKQLAFSTYTNHRSALFNLYRDFNCTMSHEMSEHLSRFFQGLKRVTALNAAAGRAPVKVGKDPLSFNFYEQLCQRLLQKNGRDFVFARCFLTMSWNLMSRAANTVSICYSHLEWTGDALCVYFAHMKNDQMGQRPRDPRHVYANPAMPHICPILALGMYWMCFRFCRSNQKLFDGVNQYDRFRKLLNRVLSFSDIQEELLRMGKVSEDFGTHSIRKGSSTYCSSGSTACPSSTAIHLRAGWTLGGVQDTYLRYEKAGDMHVGRTVTGLPVSDVTFASLPPHFDRSESTTELVSMAIQMCFFGIPSCLHQVAEFALASVVFHSEYLRCNLPEDHPIFNTSLFSEWSILSELKRKVMCGIDSPYLKATGIPPHIYLTKEIHHLRAIIKKNSQLVENLGENVASQVMEQIQEARGGMSISTLKETLALCLEEYGMFRHESEEREGNHIEQQSPSSSLQEWRRILPHNIVLPMGSVLEAWQHWCCGKQNNEFGEVGYPPLRLVHPSALKDKNMRKRYSDLKYLMKKIEINAKEKGIFTQRSTVDEANNIFGQCEDVLDELHTCNRSGRRLSQLSWITVASIVRKAEKNRVREAQEIVSSSQIQS